ncbi:MAG: SusC/RagA family TonB-linked outer membrane protein [Bacteroidia bacterium]
MKHFNLTNRKILPQQGRSFLLWCLMMIGSLAFAQAQNVSGTISDEEGSTLAGVSVLVQGTTTGVLSDNEGKYSISAKSGDVLIFSYIAFEPQTATVSDSRTLNVTLKASTLEEVLVTGYATQRQKDITGAVSVINTEEMNDVAASSFIQKLEGRASGVTISTSGNPGDGTTVRIRGISSFQNNDPLYIIDGVPVQDAYQNGLNPNDIETIQVLKDASAASIYGARANNGVIIITTKKGSAGKTTVTYNGYVGIQNPVGRYDLITNPADYSQVVWDAHENAGLTVDPGNPYSAGRGVIPNYIYSGASSGYPGSDPVDESSYAYPSNLIMKASAGTDWWNEVFDPAIMTEHSVGVAGGNNSGRYYISANYLDQQGTMINTWFKRAAIRANSEMTKGRVTFGENFSLARSQGVSMPGGNQNEGNVMTQILKAQAIVPVYDVAGNFGGGKANGLSNGSNPVAQLVRNKDNVGTYYRVLGNIFAEVEILDGLKAKTSYGVDYFDNYNGGFRFPTWEESEPNTINGFSENWSKGYTWTWTNTLNYTKTFGVHNLQALAGYEAIRGQFRNINGGLSNYFTTDINAWYLNTGLADPGSRTVGSGGGYSALASAFAKFDYGYDDRYLVSLTVRRDGSSNFGDQKYGTFPAASVGWRLSSESFMQGLDWLDDLKLRFGWGKTGNQSIPSGNAFDQFGGGPGQSSYDIGGTNNSVTTGFALIRRGNADTKWEENVSSNIGIDASILGGKFLFVLDLYQRTVDGLLFNPQNPNTGGTAAPAFINIAKMENRGVDFSVDYRDNFGDFGIDLGLAFTAYRNEIIEIDGVQESFFSTGGDTRIGRTSINVINNPIGTFYGFQEDGLFRTQEEVDAHATQDGAAVGRIRFKDISGDGIINDDDLGVIGSPHPDFTAGLNIGLNYKNIDFTMFIFGSQGNEIFNYNKLFEVFRFFNTNVRQEVLTEAFHPTNNPNGTLPIMDENDTFSERPNSFYVEDASYIRMKQMQLGYTLPTEASNRLGVGKLRIYLQAQNLFTLTNYSGIDPALSNFGVRGNSDQWNGNDFGNYPSSKIFMAGVSLEL